MVASKSVGCSAAGSGHLALRGGTGDNSPEHLSPEGQQDGQGKYRNRQAGAAGHGYRPQEPDEQPQPPEGQEEPPSKELDPFTEAAKVDIIFSVSAWHFGHWGLGAQQALTRFSNVWPHLLQRYSYIGMASLSLLEGFIVRVF
jgi:hypothetical protein